LHARLWLEERNVHRVIPRVGRLTLACGLAALALTLFTHAVEAQTFQGRVLGQGTQEPVGTALVKLVDEDGAELAITIADSAGLYRVEAEEPGVFRLVAERIGYRPLESPLLEALDPNGTYPIDLEMTPAPVELRGFTVMTDRLPEEEADRTVRQIIGLSPKSLRFRSVDFLTLQDHLARAHTLVDVMRWEFGAGIIVYETRDGPCFGYRGRSCLPVYLNGLALNRDFIAGVPLDMVFRVQVLTPNDGSVMYPGGAVLLFTEAWLR
jgi:hypothetical protein